MKEYIEEPAYPAFDLSYEKWDNFVMGNVIVYDSYCYKYLTRKKFNQLFYGRKIVDHQGRVFLISDFKNLSLWRRFIPFIKKSKFVYQPTNQIMSFEEIKKYLLKKVLELNSEYYKELEDHLVNANTILELFS